MPHPTVVILGAGTGGLTVARRLRQRLDPAARVVLIERDPIVRFAPSFLWVMSGARRRDQIVLDISRQRRRGVEVVIDEVTAIDPAAQLVRTQQHELAYDRLVIALGAELAPDALPGFAESAHNVYTIEGAETARDALRSFSAGRLAVLVSRLPYKCPAAPYETALLADALLRQRGVRDQVAIDLYTPEPYPMPTAGAAVGAAVRGILEERAITLHPDSPVTQVDTASRELVLAGGERAAFDLLLGVPPHRAPAVLRDSGLAGESGWVAVDKATLATAVAGVSAIGDVTAIPIAGGKFLPKAGVFAHDQADVVAHRIADELAGRSPRATFDGNGACFLETGQGRAGYAAGDFYAAGGPAVKMRSPARHWHLAKVAFEQYWLRRWR